MSYLAKARYFKDSFMFIAKGLHLVEVTYSEQT